ncbi:hypothetical protein PYCC9005_003549 [Savitreella phatthalungensis]
MVYLKSSLLSHLSRITKQHGQAFFTANTTHSSALTAVRPKLSLAADSAGFSSWSGQSYTASQGVQHFAQQALIIGGSSNDDASQDSKHDHRRAQLLTHFNKRSYSTSSETLLFEGRVVSDQDGVAALVAGPDTSSVPSRKGDSELIADLAGRLQTECYTDVYDRLIHHLDTGATAGLEAFNIALVAVDALDYRARSDQAYYTSLGIHKRYQASLEHGIDLFGRLLQGNQLPDEQTYVLLMRILIRHWKSEVDLLNKFSWLSRHASGLQSAGDELAMVDMAVGNEVGRNAVELFTASLSSARPSYDVETLDALLAICAQRADRSTAIQIFDYFGEHNVAQSSQSYIHMVECLAAAGELEEAISVFDLYKARIAHIAQHNIHAVYAAVAEAYVVAKQPEKGLKFWKRVIHLHRDTSQLTWHSQKIISTLVANGHGELALSCYADISPGSKAQQDRVLATIGCAAARCDDIETLRKVLTLILHYPSFHSVQNASTEILAALCHHGLIDELAQFCARCLSGQALDLHLGAWEAALSRLLAAGRDRDAVEMLCRLLEVQTSGRDAKVQHRAVLLEILLQQMYDGHHLSSENLRALAGPISSRPGLATERTAALWIDGIAEAVEAEEIDILLLERFTNIARLLLGRRDGVVEEANLARAAEVFSRCFARLSAKLEAFAASLDRRTLSELALIADRLSLPSIQADIRRLIIIEQNALPQRTGKHLSIARQVFTPMHARSHDGTRTLCATLRQTLRNSPTSAPEILISAVSKELNGGGFLPGEVAIQLISFLGQVGAAHTLRDLQEPLLRSVRGSLIDSAEDAAGQALLLDFIAIAWFDMAHSTQGQAAQKRIVDLGYMPSARSFAARIAKIDDAQCHDSASEAIGIFRQAVEHGVRPDVYLFNTVIAKLARARRSDDALDMFEQMKACGLTPTAVTFGTLINACCRVGKTEQAEQFLQELEDQPGHQPRIAPYNTLIQHFVQVKKDRAKALHYFDKLQRRAISPSSHTYRLLIEAHGHIQPANPTIAEDVIRHMRTCRVQVESIHHAQIILMYGVVLRDSHMAKLHFERALSSCALDHTLAQAMLEAYVANDDVSGMEATLRLMSKQKLKPNAYTTNLAIQGYEKTGESVKGRKLFDALPLDSGTNGKEPSTYEAMIRLYLTAGEPDKAKEILHELDIQDYPPAVATRIASLLT